MKKNKFILFSFILVVLIIQCNNKNEFEKYLNYLIKNELCDSLIVEKITDFNKRFKTEKLSNIKYYNHSGELIEEVTFDSKGKKNHNKVYNYNFHNLDRIETFDNSGKLKFKNIHNLKMGKGQDFYTHEYIKYRYIDGIEEKFIIEKKKYDKENKLVEEFKHYLSETKTPQIKNYIYYPNGLLKSRIELDGIEDKFPDIYNFIYDKGNLSKIITTGKISYFLKDSAEIQNTIDNHIETGKTGNILEFYLVDNNDSVFYYADYSFGRFQEVQSKAYLQYYELTKYNKDYKIETLEHGYVDYTYPGTKVKEYEYDNSGNLIKLEIFDNDKKIEERTWQYLNN